MRSLGKLLAVASTVLLTLLGALFTCLSYIRSRLPYNEQGNYFDGAVVLHEQAVGVYALLAFIAFAMAGLSLMFLRRLKKNDI